MFGWHFKRADAEAGYALFIPTGRYTDGAQNNTGLGMWGQEPSFGTTVYLTESKQYHAASMVSFDFQSTKKDSTTKVGNAMNLQGGLGGDFLKGGLTAGLAYYGMFKLTDDFIGPLANQLIRGKNSAFALGPEATLAIVTGKAIRGFVTVRYQWELYARTTTQGNALNVSLSLLAKPIHLP